MTLFCRLLIGYVEDKNNPDDKWRGYVYGIAMFAVALVQSIALQQYFHVVFTLGMNVRTAVIGMVYSKVLAECRTHVKHNLDCIFNYNLK